jgi:hypothetical protein
MMLLDEHLSFNQHCAYICNKIAQSNYIIAKSKNLLPIKTLKTLYFALVHSNLLYCLPLYSCTTAKNINKLFVMQKKAIRNVCNANYNAHTAQLFNNLKILPLNKLIIFTQGLLTHSIIHKYGPKILHTEWTTNQERNPGLELRNANDIYIPDATTEQVKKLPLFTFAKLWNDLPESKTYANPILFKNLLNQHLWDSLT